MTPASPLRVALVGAGFFGATLARAASASPDFALASVTDLNHDAGTLLAAELGTRFEPDLAAAALADDVDIAFVATPNHTHRLPALAFLNAGKHVFVEKPLAITTEDVEAMLAAAQAGPGRLIVGHILRTLPGIRRMKEAIATGGIGAVLEGHAARTRLVHIPEGAGEWWKLDRARTGGELLHEIHELDLITWLLGEPVSVRSLAAVEATDRDTAHKTLMAFGSGAVALHEVSTSAHTSAWMVRVSGSKGTLVADFRSARVRRIVEDAEVEVWDLFEAPASNESLRAAATQKQSYNSSTAATPAWMADAVACELRAVAAAVRDGDSVLLAQPATAVLAGIEALAPSDAAAVAPPAEPAQAAAALQPEAAR